MKSYFDDDDDDDGDLKVMSITFSWLITIIRYYFAAKKRYPFVSSLLSLSSLEALADESTRKKNRK